MASWVIGGPVDTSVAEQVVTTGALSGAPLLTADDVVYGLGGGIRGEVAHGFAGSTAWMKPYKAGTVGPTPTAVSGGMVIEPGVEFLAGGFTVAGEVSILASTNWLAETSVGFGVQALTGPEPRVVNSRQAFFMAGHIFEDSSRYEVGYHGSASPTSNPRSWDESLNSAGALQIAERPGSRTFVIHRPADALDTLILFVANARGGLREMKRLTGLPPDTAYRAVLRGHTGLLDAGVALHARSLTQHDVDLDARLLVRSKRIRCAVIGDSVALNSGVEPHLRPDALVRDIGPDGVQILNFARNGARIYDGTSPGTGIMEAGIVDDVAAASPDAVLLQVGSNDMDAGNLVGTEVERKGIFRSHLLALIKAVQRRCGAVPIILAQTPAVGDRTSGNPEGSVTQGREKLRPAKEVLEAVAAERGFALADIHDQMLPHIDTPDFFLPDLIHPAAVGCSFLALGWRRGIEQALGLT